ncbi:MAG: hypothetical protein FWG14_07695 [Peptococcaceae bacterium]|nr:hypothetical protein [Peptococcaceae bacterium]
MGDRNFNIGKWIIIYSVTIIMIVYVFAGIFPKEIDRIKEKKSVIIEEEKRRLTQISRAFKMDNDRELWEVNNTTVVIRDVYIRESLLRNYTKVYNALSEKAVTSQQMEIGALELLVIGKNAPDVSENARFALDYFGRYGFIEEISACLMDFMSGEYKEAHPDYPYTSLTQLSSAEIKELYEEYEKFIIEKD